MLHEKFAAEEETGLENFLVNIDHHPAVVVNFDTIAILLKVTDVGDSEAPHQNEITASLGKQLFREHFDLFVDYVSVC